jgi:hypothetical protein
MGEASAPLLFAPKKGWGLRSMIGSRVVDGLAIEVRRRQALIQVGSEHMPLESVNRAKETSAILDTYLPIAEDMKLPTLSH